MKTTILAAIAALFVMGSMIASVEEASALTCVRGVYRAGCVGGVYHRPVVVHRTVVHRRVVR